MAANLQGVNFTLAQGGLGRELPGEDHITGLVFFPATYPAGFSNSDKIKKVQTLAQAETLGITQALFPIEHYHISEFFRMLANNTTGTGTLWLYLGDTVGLETYDATQVATLQAFVNGTLRQVGVYTNETFASSLVTDAYPIVKTLRDENTPTLVILAADFSGVADLTALADLRALSSGDDDLGVGVVIGEDGSGVGAALAVAEAQSISSLGMTMGAIASAPVNINIGWVLRFNVVDRAEYDEPAYANGDLFKDTAKVTAEGIDDKGYISIIKRPNNESQAFHFDTPLAVGADSDFAQIENDRTIGKAIREVNKELSPFINGPVFVDQVTGQITEESAGQIETAAKQALIRMAIAQEISVDQTTGEIDPASVVVDRISDILATSTVNVTVKITPVGVARQIEVNIGFVAQIQ